MRVLIAPDKFKGCLSAAEAAGAIAEGLEGVEVDCCPVADGGEGTVEAMVAATGGRWVEREVMGPLPEMRVRARFGVLGDGETAVIEMAAASGLHLLKAEQRNPMRTTTYGTGELIVAAREMGVRRIVLGIGGSATTDGGLGCAQAWGAVVEMEDGGRRSVGDRAIVGSDVARVKGVEVHGRAAHATEMVVACDVSNPLYGAEGAAVVYGPQKGATGEQVRELDGALEKLARRVNRVDLAERAGAGAAGGLGFGMMAFFGATIRPGVEMVLEAVRFEQRLRGVDLCLTGEGRFDGQSLAGKAPMGVARACKARGVPCVVLAGGVEAGAERALGEGVTAYFSICERPMTVEEAMGDARGLLRRLAGNVMRVWRRG